MKPEEEEIRKLKRELHIIKMERDILKKPFLRYSFAVVVMCK